VKSKREPIIKKGLQSGDRSPFFAAGFKGGNDSKGIESLVLGECLLALTYTQVVTFLLLPAPLPY
jgi:hypothetical protein